MTTLLVPALPTLTITPVSLESVSAIASAGTAASSVWPAANRAIYIPFRLYAPIVAVKMFVVNGAAVSGNIDMGLYDAAGTRLVSKGSTAQAGTNTMQILDITDTTLGVGLFYLALAIDNGTGTTFRKNVSIQSMRACGCYQMASAFPLPATATYAAIATSYLPIFGLTTDSVI